MSRYISKKKRLFVRERALQSCEYCRIPELFSFLGFEIDHIISIKHGGSNELDNLSWACAFCNNYKGSDLGTILLPAKKIIRFYNPRVDLWEDNFEFSGPLINPKTDIGEATIKIFQFNEVNRIIERELCLATGLIPPFNPPFFN